MSWVAHISSVGYANIVKTKVKARQIYRSLRNTALTMYRAVIYSVSYGNADINCFLELNLPLEPRDRTWRERDCVSCRLWLKSLKAKRLMSERAGYRGRMSGRAKLSRRVEREESMSNRFKREYGVVYM